MPARRCGSAWPTGRPTGFIGRMFKIVGAHVPPPAGVPSPLAWGTEARLDELLRRRHRGRRHPASLRVPLPVGRATSSRRSRRTTGRPSQAWACARRGGPRLVPRTNSSRWPTSATATPRNARRAVRVPRGRRPPRELSGHRRFGWRSNRRQFAVSALVSAPLGDENFGPLRTRPAALARPLGDQGRSVTLARSRSNTAEASGASVRRRWWPGPACVLLRGAHRRGW